MADVSPLMDGGYALITRSKRVINAFPSGFTQTIIPDVMVEEVATDTLHVTDHPVETGSAISDHAFTMPAEIVMRCGFSTSTKQDPTYVAMVYFYLVALQQTREPFTVVTPDRIYKDMLISSILKTADETLSFAALITVAMRRVILTDTTITSGPKVTGEINTSPAPTAPSIEQLAPGATTGIPLVDWFNRPSGS
jgi:hypothetical protein